MIDYLDINNNLDVKSKVSPINNWLTSTGIINDYVINNLVLFTMSCDFRIKDLEIFVDKKNKTISFLIYLSRWSFFWSSKKIYNNIKSAIIEYIPKYNIKIAFDIYKGKKQND